jgi:PHD/YefM family antitoxin component YafN of YafNO toxin-antitoxin module
MAIMYEKIPVSYETCYAPVMRTERQDASTARVPPVEAGTAVIVTRYGRENAVVLSPADFHRLAALDEALEAIAAGERAGLSELARKAHRIEDEPGAALEDPVALARLLGR